MILKWKLNEKIPLQVKKIEGEQTKIEKNLMEIGIQYWKTVAQNRDRRKQVCVVG